MLLDNSPFCDNLPFWVFSNFKEQVVQARFFDFLDPWLQLKPGIYLGFFLKKFIIYVLGRGSDQCWPGKFIIYVLGRGSDQCWPGIWLGGLEPLGKDLDPYTLSGTRFQNLEQDENLNQRSA
jgi:hypothetical protein